MKINFKGIILTSLVSGSCLGSDDVQKTLFLDKAPSIPTSDDIIAELDYLSAGFALFQSSKSNYFVRFTGPKLDDQYLNLSPIEMQKINITYALNSMDTKIKHKAFFDYLYTHINELEHVGLEISPLQRNILNERSRIIFLQTPEEINQQLFILLNGGFSEISSTDPTTI